MNFDDYDNHILQKYRLAVAIAIIKNTPKNCTPKNHLQNLKNNIAKEMEAFDPDMTICEDDFDLDDDEDLNDDKNEKATKQSQNNDTQIVDSQANDSVTILKDFDFNDMIRNTENDRNIDVIETDSVSNVLNIMRGVDNDDLFDSQIAFKNNDPFGNLNATQSTYYESSQSILPQSLPEHIEVQKNKFVIPSLDKENTIVVNSDRDISDNKVNFENRTNNTEDATFYDSEKTIIYTLHGFTDNFTHISESQTDNIILPKYLLDRAKPLDHSKVSGSKTNENDLDSNADGTFKKNLRKNEFNAMNNSQRPKLKDRIIANNNSNDNNVNTEPIHTKNKLNTAVELKTQICDSKKHKSYNDGSENPKSKRFRNIDQTKDYCDLSIENYNEINNYYNSEDLTDLGINLSNTLNKPNTQTSINITEKTPKDLNISNTDANIKKQPEFNIRNLSHSQNSLQSNPNKLMYNSLNFSQFSQEFDSDTITDKTNFHEIGPNASQKNIHGSIKDSEKDIEGSRKDLEAKSDEEREMFEMITDSQKEVVPFKVLEELNKVKSFLNKVDRRNSSDCVSDSGYKSDSQSRSSFKSALKNAWLNQSAHTLMSFIIRCPLAANTADITNEISRTLGRLIDRLHQDEKYPSFLEEHLEAVEVLLKELFEEELNENQILKKDENIHRLLLLNKSSHIIKFSIEKIIAILEDVHTKLTSEEMYEITHTNQTENLPYIFHTLETLIKKLLIFKNVSSQSTQNSQEDEGILKKSSITDIWRKKWNFSKKSDFDLNAGSSKQCVLVQCSDVLNKIIVQAMDGYSLISFYALQCFNLLQN